ncbi:unnamed protein product [Ambrosiozyma monospora]|uniref:Unnamed protein product n=1 Tax=Ambrosiozyma monospora TaxID=43982 RepID=A0ACB5TU72_AMBMO|nr:unnamed protein product [Ambrosiozyma monospora]
MSSIRPDLKFTDDRDQISFYKKYQQLPPSPQRTLRVVDKTDYYTILDEDAELVADLIYKTQSVLKTAKQQHSNGAHIQYLTLSHAVFANLVKTVVLEMGYKLEIYDKSWSNCKCASPGNLGEVERYLTGDADEVAAGSVIAALKLVSSAADVCADSIGC